MSALVLSYTVVTLSLRFVVLLIQRSRRNLSSVTRKNVIDQASSKTQIYINGNISACGVASNRVNSKSG